MSHYLDATGLHTDSYETIRAEIVTALHAAISPVLDLSEQSPDGALISLLANRERTVVELAEEVYAGSYPSTADGFQVDLISALSGCYRQPATKSTLDATEADVQLAAGATLPAGSVAHVDGIPSDRFVTVAAVTNGGGAPAWIPCAFEAEETGPVQCLSGTLSTIAEPVVGWLAVQSTSDATEGEDEETDADYRLRRVQELAQGGASTAVAVLADLSALTGMISVAVLENDGDHVDADGLPGHSIAPVVYDGTEPPAAPVVTDAVIAAAILGALDSGKSAGIRSWGTTLEGVEDSQGEIHEIGFTRADILDLYIDVDLSTDGDYDEDLYPAGAGLVAAVQTALVDWGGEDLGLGDEVVYLRLAAVVLGVEGINDITALTCGWAAPPGGVVNLAVGRFEIAHVDSANIGVTP